MKGVRENREPFGGIQILLFGDFFQLPPVDDNRQYCFKSKTWEELNLKTVILKETKRQSEKELVDALNNVRIDKTSVDDLRVFYERDISPTEEPPKDILRIFSTNNDADMYNKKLYTIEKTIKYGYVLKKCFWKKFLIDLMNMNQKTNYMCMTIKTNVQFMIQKI